MNITYRIIMKLSLSALFLLLTVNAFTQSSNDILNLLIANKSITQQQADSIRAEAAIKQQETDAGRKSFFATAARQMTLSGYTQIRYQVLDEKGKKDGFDIRRARLDLNGNFTPFLAYRLMADFADKPKLMDAYAEIKIRDYFNITLGQFRVPFSVENLTPVRKFELIDFSQVVDALVLRGKDVIGNQNGRDIGIQLGGGLINQGSYKLIEYKIGVFNGSGINIADTANEAKDIIGRVIVNPAKGFSIGASYYNGWGKAIKPTADYRGKSQPRTRFGVEASYTLTRLLFRGEYIQGVDGSIDKAGWYLLAGYYVIPQKLQVICKYDTYDPNKSSDSDITTNYVAGLNFNFNNWSRIQAFYTIREEQGAQISNNYLSLQYQIGF
jgi:phosphate-selective porin OprO and OprP